MRVSQHIQGASAGSGRTSTGQPKTQPSAPATTPEAAHRRLAIAILRLDVATLAAQLQAQRSSLGSKPRVGLRSHWRGSQNRAGAEIRHLERLRRHPLGGTTLEPLSTPKPRFPPDTGTVAYAEAHSRSP